MYEEEDEEEARRNSKTPDENSFRIYGSANLLDVQEALDIVLPIEDYRYTLEDLFLAGYGSIPDDGEQFDVHLKDMDVTVKEMKNHRVMETIVNVIQRGKRRKEHETTSGSN